MQKRLWISLFTSLGVLLSVGWTFCQCPDSANITKNDKCLYLRWDTPPDMLELFVVGLVPIMDTADYQEGDGTLGNPAIYKYRGGMGSCNSAEEAFEGSFIYGEDTCTYPDDPLSIGLVYLDFERDDQQVAIIWRTASEISNEGFSIQRSSSDLDWHDVGWIDGKKFSTELNEYIFIDTKPLEGTNYYRLKQIDFDGSIWYSPILAVDFSLEREIRLYPNPVKQVLNIASPVDEIRELSLYNGLGQRIMTLNSNLEKLDLSNLASGFYIVEMQVKGKKELRKIIVE